MAFCHFLIVGGSYNQVKCLFTINLTMRIAFNSNYEETLSYRRVVKSFYLLWLYSNSAATVDQHKDEFLGHFIYWFKFGYLLVPTSV